MIFRLALCLALSAPLAACRSIEGAGFSNSGAYAGQRLCQRREGNVVRWYSC